MRKISISLLCYQVLIMGMIMSSTGLVLPRLKEEIGLTLVQQGSLVSIQYFGFFVAVLFGGTLTDRFETLKILRTCFWGLGLATFTFAASSTYWITVTGVFLIGAFGSLSLNTVTLLATNFKNKDSERTNAFTQMFFTIGAIITPLMLLLSMFMIDNWRIPYYIIAVLCMVMSLVVLGYTDNKEKKHTSIKRTFSQYTIAFKRPIYLVAPIALILYVGSETGIWGFAPIFFENQGYGKVSGLLSSILIWLCMFAGRAFSLRLLKKFSMSKILIIHGILAIVSLTIVMFANQALSIIFIGISGFAFSPFYPLIVTWMTKLTGDKSSGMLAFIIASGALGPVIMGWLNGIIVDNFGPRYVTAAPAGSFVLLVIILALFRNTKARSCESKTELTV